MRSRNLSEDLEKWHTKIKAYISENGLTCPKVNFLLVDYDEVNTVAAYGGFPTRYPHWRFGMEYEQLRKTYEYGFSVIYEMVINTDPCYAYLHDCNDIVNQLTVMAHVYGHADFFKNNYTFKHTDKRMLDKMANHSTRIRRYIDRYGLEPVEEFIDACLSLDNLIYPQSVHFAKSKEPEELEGPMCRKKQGLPKFNVGREYMDSYINPKEAIQQEIMRKRREIQKKKGKFPVKPERDVLQFLLDYSDKLMPWQRSILDMIREEAYYFVPQGQTKIMNEGWACFWHARTMRDLMEPNHFIDFADNHSGVISNKPDRMNSYRLGLQLFQDIEERWNKGRHGPAYDACEDMVRKEKWDTGEMKGLEKIFEVRKHYNDVTFLDEFLTDDFCRKHKLFTYSKHNIKPFGPVWRIDSREFEKVKEKLLTSLTNFGQPIILVEDGNYLNRGELLLHHDWQGVDMDYAYAEKTLINLEKVWQRPVNLKTKSKEEWFILSCAGGCIDYEPVDDEQFELELDFEGKDF